MNQYSTSSKRKKALRKRSVEQAKRMELLKEEYSRVFATNPKCVWCGRNGATSPHHFSERRRNGDGLFVWVPTHQQCHDYIHAHPKEAVARQLLDCPWEDRNKYLVHVPNPLFLNDEEN